MEISNLLLSRCDMEKKVIGAGYEGMILQKTLAFLTTQKRLGVEPPFLLMLSALGVSGYTMYVHLGWSDPHPIDRDTLLIPEVLVESFESDLTESMKPAFDAIWNASGFKGSPQYDEEGKWKES